MLRLLKLAAYSLLGYAIFEFVRGATDGDVKGAFKGVKDKIEGGADQLGRRARHIVEAASDEIEEAGEKVSRASKPGNGRTTGGQKVATKDIDGGSVTHSVGRGVIS